jgi:hypothetical protein
VLILTGGIKLEEEQKRHEEHKTHEHHEEHKAPEHEGEHKTHEHHEKAHEHHEEHKAHEHHAEHKTHEHHEEQKEPEPKPAEVPKRASRMRINKARIWQFVSLILLIILAVSLFTGDFP